ncbi:MAG: hypothetical protein ACR2GF_00710 [Acidimicrobiales bacterium]
MRRRRLDVYRNSPPWPGKDLAWRSEFARYDHCLVVVAQMLEVPGVDPEGGPLTPEARAVLEDRLALAGLDVMGDISRPTSDVLEEDY